MRVIGCDINARGNDESAGLVRRAGIRAVAVKPGPVLTSAGDRDLGDDQAMRAASTEKTLRKRLGRPEEVGELAAFRASGRAAYITGADLTVDGASSSR